jgi:hypothetical protein
MSGQPANGINRLNGPALHHFHIFRLNGQTGITGSSGWPFAFSRLPIGVNRNPVEGPPLNLSP